MLKIFERQHFPQVSVLEFLAYDTLHLAQLFSHAAPASQCDAVVQFVISAGLCVFEAPR